MMKNLTANKLPNQNMFSRVQRLALCLIQYNRAYFFSDLSKDHSVFVPKWWQWCLKKRVHWKPHSSVVSTQTFPFLKKNLYQQHCAVMSTNWHVWEFWSEQLSLQIVFLLPLIFTLKKIEWHSYKIAFISVSDILQQRKVQKDTLEDNQNISRVHFRYMRKGLVWIFPMFLLWIQHSIEDNSDRWAVSKQ